jgi:hypothetical protein
VSRKMGYRNANLICMMEKGNTRVPNEKAEEISNILEMDAKWFARMVLRDRYPTVERLLFEEEKIAKAKVA